MLLESLNMFPNSVRSHLENCDIIYDIPGLNNQSNLGVTLNLFIVILYTTYQA